MRVFSFVTYEHSYIEIKSKVFFVLGLMFQTTKKAANYFIALQYAQISDDEEIKESDSYGAYSGSNLGEFNTIAGPVKKKDPVVDKIIFHKIGLQDMATVSFIIML